MKSVDEVMDHVRGIVRSVEYKAAKPRQREWMHIGGFSWIMNPEETGLQDNVPVPWRLDETQLPVLMEAANKDPYALEAAKELAKMHLQEGKPLPEALAKFVSDCLDKLPKGKRIESPAIRARDEFVAMLIGILKNEAGVPPTRNETTKHRESGCDLVVQAYQDQGKPLTYDVAAKAWKSYGKL